MVWAAVTMHRRTPLNDFVRVNDINRMDWPANSPELNPIENLWDELGRRTYRDNPPQTFPQLRHRLAQEWQNIPQATIRRCVRSMLPVVCERQRRPCSVLTVVKMHTTSLE